MQLLPGPYDSLTYALLQDYVDLRIKISTVDLTRIEERKSINEETDKLQKQDMGNLGKSSRN
jgi:hypothetical protein